MENLSISVHGGRECKNCRWKHEGGFGKDDWYTDVFATHAVVALDERGHVAGIWKFDKPYYKAISSAGTWVAPKYRKKGLAKKLWETVIQKENPKRITVRLASDKGCTLISSLKESYPNIKWNITDEGNRKLRNLKRKKD